jgi:hypothetical protein
MAEGQTIGKLALAAATQPKNRRKGTEDSAWQRQGRSPWRRLNVRKEKDT